MTNKKQLLEFMRRSFLVGLVTIAFVATGLRAQTNSDPVTSTGAGAFTEMGYNPRSAAIGGATVAVIEGEFQFAASNPAVAAFQDGYRATFSYSALNLDRTLNFVGISGPVPGVKRDTLSDSTSAKKSIASSIHLQLGWLRAGVGNIDSRDYEGDKIGTLSSSENEFLGAAAVRITPKFALGFAARFYYSTLPFPDPTVPKITSSGFGLDIGAVYIPRDNVTVAATIQHIAAKYHWDSSTLYGQTGSSTTDYFPLVLRLGATWKPVDELMIAVDLANHFRLYDQQDFVTTSAKTAELALGVEYELTHGFYLRGGVRGIDLTNQLKNETGTSLGFAYTFSIQGIKPTIAYALLNDAVSTGPTQMISIGLNF